MASDEALTARLRDLFAAERGITEKGMFGGRAFLLEGKLVVAASGKGGLLARIDPADAERVLAGEHVAPMVMRGRPMAGWIRVDEAGLRTKRDVARWVQRSLAFVRSLPAASKPGTKRRAAAPARPPPGEPKRSGRTPR